MNGVISSYRDNNDIFYIFHSIFSRRILEENEPDYYSG